MNMNLTSWSLVETRPITWKPQVKAEEPLPISAQHSSLLRTGPSLRKFCASTPWKSFSCSVPGPARPRLGGVHVGSAKANGPCSP